MSRRAPTSFTRLLGIEQPIVLGAFGGLSSVELTAVVSEEGGLGSYGLYGYDAARIRETAAALRARTDRPFALNLWLPVPGEVAPEPDDEAFARHLDPLRPYFDELGLPHPGRPEQYLPPVEEQLEAVLEARPAAVSVVFGLPDPAFVEAARARGIRLIGTATTVEEAVDLEAAGAAEIVASGAEAGGHRV
ncbi:nitronate monooxygenase, partial [Herbiconiux sp.]|uniref:nitronate monooxygenase n=1 Tax=Herbiconiux sp. TaxID=1871186 RepID=UPI0025C69821